MNRYTIYCTEEQTKKALELGAPLQYATIADRKSKCFVNLNKTCYTLPTAEEMIGWLEEQNMNCFVSKKITQPFYALVRADIQLIFSKFYDSRKEATLATIDSALEYLSDKQMED